MIFKKGVSLESKSSMWKPGDTPIPGYRLESFLGQGSFGEVWKSTSPGGTFCALKFLNLQERQGRKEFRAIQKLKQIRHPNLMPINAMWLLDENQELIQDYGFASQPILEDTVRATMAVRDSDLDRTDKPSTLVMGMSLADGNLLELLKERQQEGRDIPIDELLRYMADAAKGLDFLRAPPPKASHHASISHGDVKPENLVLVGDSVVLCDFGVARTLGRPDNVRATSLGGSMAYMAPECMENRVHEHSDQYSLAISYIELRTGELPFPENAAAIIKYRQEGRLDIEGMSPAELKVIKKATAYDPEQRYPSNMDFVSALRGALIGKKKQGNAALMIGALSTTTLLAIGVSALLFVGGGNGSPIPDDSGGAKKDDPVVEPPNYDELFAQALRTFGNVNATEKELEAANEKLEQAYDGGFDEEPPNRYTIRSGPYSDDLRKLIHTVPSESILYTVGSQAGELKKLTYGSNIESPDEETIRLDVDRTILDFESVGKNWLLELSPEQGSRYGELALVRKEGGLTEFSSSELEGHVIGWQAQADRVVVATNKKLYWVDSDGTRDVTPNNDLFVTRNSGILKDFRLLAVFSEAPFYLATRRNHTEVQCVNVDRGLEVRSLPIDIKPSGLAVARVADTEFVVYAGRDKDEKGALSVVKIEEDNVVEQKFIVPPPKISGVIASREITQIAVQPSSESLNRVLLAGNMQRSLCMVAMLDATGTLEMMDFIGLEGDYCAIAIDPDGRFVVRGTTDGQVTISEIENGRTLVLDEPERGAAITQVAFGKHMVYAVNEKGDIFGWSLFHCQALFRSGRLLR